MSLKDFSSFRRTCKTARSRCTPSIFYTHERLKHSDTKTVAEFARCIAANMRGSTLDDPVKNFFRSATLAHQQQFFTVLADHMPLHAASPLFLQCSDTITDVGISADSENVSKSVVKLLEVFTRVKNLTLKKIPAGQIQLYTQQIAKTIQSIDLSQSAPISASDFLHLLKLPALKHLKIALLSPDPFEDTKLLKCPLETLSIVCTPDNELNVQGIEQLSALTQLNITGTLSDKSFPCISMISGLQELMLIGHLKTPTAIHPLKKLHSLTSLKICSKELDMPSVHDLLKNKTSIRAVSLSFNGTRSFTIADCAQIAQNCQNLTSLCLPDPLEATDAELCTFFTYIKPRPLTKLTFTLPSTVQKETVSLLFNQASLQSLHLSCQSTVLNRSLTIPSITSLSISQPGENPLLLHSLETLTNLKYLYLSLPFTDQDTVKVYRAPALHTFTYKYEYAEGFTDHGFKILCSSPTIRQIDIQSATKLTRLAVMGLLKSSPHITYCRVRQPLGGGCTPMSFDPADGLYHLYKMLSEPSGPKKESRIFEARHIDYDIAI